MEIKDILVALINEHNLSYFPGNLGAIQGKPKAKFLNVKRDGKFVCRIWYSRGKLPEGTIMIQSYDRGSKVLNLSHPDSIKEIVEFFEV